MREAELEIQNRLGLHARAAARFVHVANQFRSRIVVVCEGTRADGKSILGLLTLAAARGRRLRLIVEGDDENEALSGLARLIDERFGEEE